MGTSCRVRRRPAAACATRCPGNSRRHPGPRSPDARSDVRSDVPSRVHPPRPPRRRGMGGGRPRGAHQAAPAHAARGPRRARRARRRGRRARVRAARRLAPRGPGTLPLVASGAAERRLAETDVSALADALAAALAPDRVLAGEDVRHQHGTDESFHAPAAPDLVAYPLDVEECARLVRVCAERRAPIVPFGAGTSLEGHIAALRGGVSVDMSRMDRVLRMSVDDMDVTVQAGVTRRQLDAKLRPEGVFFSVDPGADATIGGMVATGASGTTTVRYGAMRENVVSLLVVTADGSVVRTRSRARKSSAGYALTRLFVGSEGTLGLICEATLKVHPTPEAMAAAACPFATLEGAVTCVL